MADKTPDEKQFSRHDILKRQVWQQVESLVDRCSADLKILT